VPEVRETQVSRLLGVGAAVAAASAFTLASLDAVGRPQILLTPVFAGPAIAASPFLRRRGIPGFRAPHV